MNPSILIICDGWGINKDPEIEQWNAIAHANTPNFDRLMSQWPHTEISASGLDVGLPDGIMGNSEVGHQNIGAGRIVNQEIVRIDNEFKSKTADKNPVILQAMNHVKENNSKLHLMGLCSDGGVHSVLRHLYGLLKIFKNNNIPDVCIHFFADGRDTAQKSGVNFLADIEKYCHEIGIGRIATVSGRFWAMDRDKRWERVERAYDCLTGNESLKASTAIDALLNYYNNPISDKQQGDEFVLPTQIIDGSGHFTGNIESGDSVVCFNYRGDRPRELTRAFIDKDFDGFKRKTVVDVFYATMTEYEVCLCDNVIFYRPPKMKNILGQYLSDLGISQFRCAETEKYAHVTFFFNDYREEPFPGEDRCLIPSPKDIATYDQKPSMSAIAVKDKVVEAILSKKYGLIVVNFANPDMVGHTGNFNAAVEAVEIVDQCLGEIIAAVESVNMRAIITADHGNSEQMWDPKSNVPYTQHTTNLVNLITIGDGLCDKKLKSGGRLADIVPTLLSMMDLPKPVEMTGQSLFE